MIWEAGRAVFAGNAVADRAGCCASLLPVTEGRRLPNPKPELLFVFCGLLEDDEESWVGGAGNCACAGRMQAAVAAAKSRTNRLMPKALRGRKAIAEWLTRSVEFGSEFGTLCGIVVFTTP